MVCVLWLFALAGSPVSEAETPEQFLRALASAPAEEWLQTASEEYSPETRDSVVQRITSFQSLSVQPGRATLEDLDGGYRAVFPESRWTWSLSEGRIGSVSGTSILEWRPGGYRWITVPIFTEEGAEMGPRETICMGATAMGAVILVSMVAVWYAKRRYG